MWACRDWPCVQSCSAAKHGKDVETGCAYPTLRKCLCCLLLATTISLGAVTVD